MSSSATSVVARKVVADALKLNWSGVQVRFAVRCTLGIAIPLLVSSLLGHPLLGSSAAYGALVTGLISQQGVYRTRIGAMLAAGAALAISGLAGAMTGAFPVANIILLALWSLAGGVVASLGRSATVVAVNACVAYVLFSNPPYDTADPYSNALMVFAGSALQIVLLVLVWPLGRFRAERASLATAYASLATYAANLRAEDLGIPDAASIYAVNAAITDPQPFGGRAEIAAYQSLADEAERLRATLAALATDQHLLSEVGLGTMADAVRAVGHAAASILTDVSVAVAAGRVPERRAADMRALDDTVRALEGVVLENARYMADAQALAGQLRAAARSAVAAAAGGLVIDASMVRTSRWDFIKVRVMGERLLANCSWSSIYARHAIRLTVALTIAVSMQHVLQLAHAQWIALTVVLVLRPDFSSTFTRGVARVAGTVGGAIVASVIAAFHPNDATYIGLAIVFAGLAFALFNVSYALFSVAITGYVVYLLAFGGAAEHTSALDRVAATAIGGLLALVAYTAWPTWSRERVADDLAELIEAQRRYIGQILLAYGGPDFSLALIRDSQFAAWRARSNAEASVDQMAGEPVGPRGITLRSATSILAATRRLGVAGLTLSARVARLPGNPHEQIERLAGDLDVAMLAIVEALQSGKPPSPLPPLRDDQVGLKRILDEEGDPAVEVLVSETDLIVDSVDTIAAILGRPNPGPVG